ncbi:MAG TPA: lectin-like protein [Phycisphaerales bacterium]|nr:lectin-like protein [Phycisphaerales bacterium]
MVRSRALVLCVSAGFALFAGGHAAAQNTISPPVENPANNHWYILLDASLMPDARAKAAALGGSIVTINDADENEWVRANMANYNGVPRRLWIGLTDENAEGTYEWMNGEPVTYTNWQLSTAQPDNHLGRDAVNGEDYVEMITPALGEWNDQPSCCNVGLNPPLHAVIEFNTRPTFGACCTGTTCQVTTPAGCSNLSGTYRGDGTDCSPIFNGASNNGPFASGLPIGPNAGTVTTDTQTMSGPTVIGNLSLTIRLTHTYIGDLTIDLRNDTTGATVRVFSQLCGTNENMSVTFVDGAATLVCGTPTSGTFNPANPLSTFAGLDANGPWTLTITDHANVDGGTLESWSLTTFESVTASICETSMCGTADYNGDGDTGTDQDIEAFFACIGGTCCPTCWHLGSDFNADGDAGTDQDIEAFFRVLGGNPC